jgi:beta-xylosidase
MNYLKKIVKELHFSVVNSFPVSIANKLPLGALTKKERWSIGIYTGKSPVDLDAPKGIKNPVLTRRNVSDVRAGFVADPFMIKVDSTWFMFFEVLNQQTRRGEIGLATSEDTVNWKYEQIVLAEPFHLSYPYVFEWMNEYYMVPESHQANSIRLYKASKFPTEWSFVGNIKSGASFLDASIFRHADKWWLFTETNPQHNFDTLRLYYADELLGSWIEHPKSPIITGNAHIARPGGRVLVMNDKIIRYTQDCQPDYGTQLRAFEITELTTTSYQEREIDQNLVLEPTGVGWNGAGMHHIDPHLIHEEQWIACVDGRG